ncbi:MAG TPA: hypothetical protein VN661_00395 [Candidatus Acidoferrales bacterium]|nr:hypothetical protein [Candidatus Acidoferrales bacterium]
MTYIFGPFLSALPQRWRKELFPSLPIRWERAAFLSGLLELLLSAPLLAVWYAIFMSAFSGSGGGAYGPWAGLMGTLGFWFNPVTWLCISFTLEGILRGLGGLFAGEARGMAVISAGRWLYLRIKPEPAAQLPLVTDEITPGDADCDIKISSCRLKGEWRYPYTIRYAGGYFQVMAHKNLGAGPRPHVYSLRRLPQGEIAGGLKEYDPGDVLTPPLKLQRIEP